MLQVVLARPENHDSFTVRNASPITIRNLPRTGDVLPGQRARLGCDLDRRSAGDQLSAMTASARTKIDDVIRAANRVLVMLDHQHRVAQIAQRFQSFQ